jgi:hypothetical protein
MTHEERVNNLKAFGYTDRESEFLCRAALISGYFVRRQFLTFANRTWGKLDTSLAEKAVQNGHAKPITFRHKREVFSFCSKAFFEALGDTDNRNRRSHEVFTIKSRLITLDFVLAHSDWEFLATEREKTSFFCDKLGISVEHLPTKRYRAKDSVELTHRLFVHKYPIAVDPSSSPTSPVVVFGYVDQGVHTTSGFDSYLEQYRGLLIRVPSCRLVYISTAVTNFDAAKRSFEHRVITPLEPSGGDPSIARIHRYFENRDAYERGDLTRFDQSALIQFRRDRHDFAGVKWDESYKRWKSGDDSWRTCAVGDSTLGASAKPQFATYRSPFRYELFGTLADGATPEERVASASGAR